MALPACPLTCKALQRGTRDTLSCSSMFFRGTTLSIMTRYGSQFLLYASCLSSISMLGTQILTKRSTALTRPSTINKLSGNLKVLVWQSPLLREGIAHLRLRCSFIIRFRVQRFVYLFPLAQCENHPIHSGLFRLPLRRLFRRAPWISTSCHNHWRTRTIRPILIWGGS